MQSISSEMLFNSRRLVKQEDLNPNSHLFGGRLLEWIDEEASISAICLFEPNAKITTAHMSSIDFTGSAKLGDILEIGTSLVKIGRTSITLCLLVRDIQSKKQIVKVENIVIVHLDENGIPSPHNLARCD